MKKCGGCQKIKELSDFSKNRAKSDGLQTLCRTCKSVAQRKYYAENKDSYNLKVYQSRAARRGKARAYVKKYLSKHPCVDCGNSDIVVLEFDHVRGKKINGVGKMVAEGYSLAKIIEEIEKCEVRCCNCHRKATLSRAGISWRIECL